MHRYLLLQETTVRRRRGSGEVISAVRLPASFQIICVFLAIVIVECCREGEGVHVWSL